MGYSHHRPRGLSSLREPNKPTPSKLLVTASDRFSIDEAALVDNNPDMKQTLVEERTVSLPPVLDRNHPRALFLPIMPLR